MYEVNVWGDANKWPWVIQLPSKLTAILPCVQNKKSSLSNDTSRMHCCIASLAARVAAGSSLFFTCFYWNILLCIARRHSSIAENILFMAVWPLASLASIFTSNCFDLFACSTRRESDASPTSLQLSWYFTYDRRELASLFFSRRKRYWAAGSSSWSFQSSA